MSDYFQDENQNEKKVYTGTVENPYGGTSENPYGGGEKSGNGFGIAALILGIVSMVFFCSCLTCIAYKLICSAIYDRCTSHIIRAASDN